MYMWLTENGTTKWENENKDKLTSKYIQKGLCIKQIKQPPLYEGLDIDGWFWVQMIYNADA